MAVGQWVGLQGLLVGWIADAAYGLMSCKTLQEPIKQKLFSKSSRLTDHNIVAAIRALRMQSPRSIRIRLWKSWLLWGITLT